MNNIHGCLMSIHKSTIFYFPRKLAASLLLLWLFLCQKLRDRTTLDYKTTNQKKKHSILQFKVTFCLFVCSLRKPKKKKKNPILSSMLLDTPNRFNEGRTRITLQWFCPLTKNWSNSLLLSSHTESITISLPITMFSFVFHIIYIFWLNH